MREEYLSELFTKLTHLSQMGHTIHPLFRTNGLYTNHFTLPLFAALSWNVNSYYQMSAMHFWKLSV